MATRLSISLLASLCIFAGCKSSSDRSETKVSPSVAEALNFESLDPPERDKICQNNTLMVYVGNAEEMGTLEYAPSITKNELLLADKKAYQVKKQNVYHNVVKRSGMDFAKSLESTQCEAYHDTVINLIRIIDGPNGNDTQIILTSYGFAPSKAKGADDRVWQRTSNESMKFVDGKLSERAKKGETFEVNLPKSFESIVRKAMERIEKERPIDQVLYFIKSHGGIVSTQPASAAPGLFEYTADIKSTIKAENQKHVLLFDTHGPDGEILESDAYSYVWSKDSACTLYKADPKRFQGKIDELGCDINSYKACLAAQIGVEECSNRFPVDAFAEYEARRLAGGQTGSDDGGQGDDGQVGQGDGGAGGQGDGGAGGQGDGGAGGQGDGGAGGQGDGGAGGQGDGGEGGQGDGGEGGQGDGGEGGQGPGKELMFLDSFVPKPKLNDDTKPKADAPDSLRKLGAMATYDMKLDGAKGSSKNITSLRLPMAKNGAAPTLIVLDSCYGGDQIFNAASSSEARDNLEIVKSLIDGDKPKQKFGIVTLSNPIPTYYFTVNYDQLDATGYVTLPFVLYWGKTGDAGSTDQYPAIAQSIRDALLNPSAEDQANVVEKFATQVKAAPTDFNEDWLKLEPAVHIIEGK